MLAALLVFGSPAARALDAELNRPYHLQVILDLGGERGLTPVFADRVQRELHDILQTELGELARVEVVRDHPLLKDVRARGLEIALTAFHRVSDTKTHFVRIRQQGGRYEIQARPFDGLTALPGPVVRTEETSDRALVARTAAFLVLGDFALVGTVGKVGVEGAQVTFKGGGLVSSLKRWVDVGDVFAVVQITGGGDELHASKFEWALLQVSKPPRDGVCTCQYYHRFQVDTLTGQADVLGYRCLKLPTVRGPLRIRFIDYKTHGPYPDLRVHVGASGFNDPSPRKLITAEKGLLPHHEEPFAHIAFVSVMGGTRARAHIPVEILPGRTLDCLVSVNEQDEIQNQKEMRRDRWLRRIYDSLRAADDRVRDLNELSRQKKLPVALCRARDGLVNLKADFKSLTAERNRLRQEEGFDLTEGDKRLALLRARQQELDHFATRLARIVKEETDPRKQDMLGMIEQARLLETQAEFARAIDLYEKVLADHPRQANVRKRLVALRRAWAVQSAAHRQARQYIYEAWPRLQTPAEMKAGLPEVRKAFQVCADLGDTLSPHKILRVNVSHTDQLRKRLATLRPRDREDDRKEAEIIVAVAKDLSRLQDAVEKYVKEHKPALP
jgi:hypothetical protein